MSNFRTVGLSTTIDYFLSCNWRRPLTLSELLAELEKDEDAVLPKEIVIFPPENANEGCDTDEDSGDENVVEPNNFPGAQLQKCHQN
ncbi:hypothetical protein JTB14_034583 [Gonioctena quinquepunctata]|nr:hypothetical protein JTB14_034583 [Gonioctena quinquepunctata]